jgi:LRP1 type putative zinc finger protein
LLRCARAVDQPTTAAPGSFAREEVSLDAVFRRVRLGPDGAEVAYHATVTICGRVFRGVLYDVGSRRRRRSSTASTDTAGSSDGSSRSTAGGGLDLTLRL